VVVVTLELVEEAVVLEVAVVVQTGCERGVSKHHCQSWKFGLVTQTLVR
jgi:hypothetical protein